MTDFAALLQQGASNAWLFIPSAILLGALHGLEPGHSKTMMAAFIVAVRGTLTQAVLLGLSATISHTAVVWAIALGGRSLDPNARAKYLNSPQTPLFDKGRNLFNHGPAREACGKGAPLVVAEGYMDVIALVEAGFAAAVAPLGTAVTEEQLSLLGQLGDRLLGAGPVRAVVGDHVCAVSHERPRRLRTDPSRRSGDEDGLRHEAIRA